MKKGEILAKDRTPTLLIMAAGLGSRFGGLKQMVPVGPTGETLLDYSVYDAIRAGFGKVVFVVRRGFKSEFRETVGNRFVSLIEVAYAEQETDHLEEEFGVVVNREKPLGTGHAVICAQSCIDGPFAVINGDDFYGAESFRILADALCASDTGGQPPSGVMVGFVLEHALSKHGSVSRGVCDLDASGHLIEIEECTELERIDEGVANKAAGRERIFKGTEWVSMNMWGLQPSIFEGLRQHFRNFLKDHAGDEKAEFYLPECVGELIREKRMRVRVVGTPENWLGLTYAEDREHVARELRLRISARQYPECLWPE